MGYTWTDGELITATKLNNTGGGGCAIVELSATGFPTSTQSYGYIAYAVYDDNNSMWIVLQDDSNYWMQIIGFANNAPKIIPPFYTVLPSDDTVGLFFIGYSGATISVTGDITATNLYFNYGSMVLEPTYLITGNGSISLVID